MPIYADFDLMWTSLPQWSDVHPVSPPEPPEYKAFPQIPGLKIPITWETCCIQMSHAFNASGLPIRYHNSQRVLRDLVGNEYMLDVTEMRNYLSDSYGPPENLARADLVGRVIPRFLTEGMLQDRKGLIVFGGRHIDLWNGSRIHGENYNLQALWEAASAIRDGVFFWDVGQ